MSIITAKIVADSISPANHRLTTMELHYPRAIHSELLTHRAFSRNSSSSRAIPISTMIQHVVDDPVMPVYWGRAQRGMQAGDELDQTSIGMGEVYWLEARDEAVRCARALAALGAAKEIVNRVIEPWMWIDVVVTATDWTNFFMLRDHPAAEKCIGMQTLAAAMAEAYSNKPVVRTVREGGKQRWHLPYIDDAEREWLPLDLLVKISTARCARVSYVQHGQTGRDFMIDCELADALTQSKPPHSSPAEHCAMACDDDVRRANFTGWQQYRGLLETGGLELFASDD